MNARQHFCLTVGARDHYTVHVDGNIRDAIRLLERRVNDLVSHGRGCTCPDPESKHYGNEIIQEEVSA